MKAKFTLQFNRITNAIITGISVGKINTSAAGNIYIQALWDTGAGISVISKPLAIKLGLVPVDIKWMTGISGSILSNRYDISVTIPDTIMFPIIRVAEWAGNRHYDMLIGMDIISRGNFSILNKNGKTVFSFKI